MANNKKKTDAEKLQELEKKYKILADKYRKQQMQRFSEMQQKEKTFSRLKDVILTLVQVLIKFAPDENIVEYIENLRNELSTIKI